MPRSHWTGREAGTWRALAGLAALVLLAGCGGIHVLAQPSVPPPLIDELPLRAGLYYSPEFRAYAAHEERWGTKWEITLGAAHVTQIDRLVKAMFAGVVPVADLAKPPAPPLDLILEPRFEEYAFVTPRDAGSEIFAVTIKYRINVYDGAARLIDSLVLTGYGNEQAGSLSSGKPLAAATRKAMRDAGAKFATEFPDQPVVQKLLRHEPVEPVPTGASAAAATPGGIAEVTLPAGPPPAPKAPPAAAAPAGATAPAPGPAAAGTPPVAAPASPPAAPAAEAPSPAAPAPQPAPAPPAGASGTPAAPPTPAPSTAPAVPSGPPAEAPPAPHPGDAPAGAPDAGSPPPAPAPGPAPAAPPRPHR